MRLWLWVVSRQKRRAAGRLQWARLGLRALGGKGRGGGEFGAGAEDSVVDQTLE